MFSFNNSNKGGKMDRKLVGSALAILLMATLFSVIGLPQGTTPKGIIPTPPESQGLMVRIWVDKSVYTVGEPISIYYNINQQAYIYIWDIEPDGTVNPIFPGSLPGTQQNFVAAGEHTVPGNWTIDRPLGTEYLQILATTTPVNPFFFMTEDAEEFSLRIQNNILGVMPISQRSWNSTSFDIVSAVPVSYGTLTINSVPSGAWITANGNYLGQTPCVIHLTQNYYQIVVNKTGYHTWTRGVFIIAGRARSITAKLEPIAPTNRPPIAAFSYSPAEPLATDPITFNATTSYDPDGSIASYTWGYGDGTAVITRNYPWDSHSFAAGGTYTITLTVTDDKGLTGTSTRTIQVAYANDVPVAIFSHSPTYPGIGERITLNATGSYDPDGYIVSYQWDLDGDGITDASGQVAHVRYYNLGMHLILLTVIDNAGLSSTQTQGITVVGGYSVPGAPPMNNIPGIFVWGTSTWHITVNPGREWIGARDYSLELQTDGSFQNVHQPTSEGITPMGITPNPTDSGRKLLFQGTLLMESLDYTFETSDSSSIWMNLRFDIDGDGILEKSSSFVYLRNLMVHPPTLPFVVGLRGKTSGPLIPSTNFWLGFPFIYNVSGPVRSFWINWGGQIEDLEGY